MFHDCYEWQNGTSAAWTSATYRRDMWWIDQNEEVTWLSLHCPLRAFASDSISPPVRRVDRRAESWVHVVSYRRARLQPVWNRQSRLRFRSENRTFVHTPVWEFAWLSHKVEQVVRPLSPPDKKGADRKNNTLDNNACQERCTARPFNG